MKARNMHQDHHLSVHWTLWKTYIVCEECGHEYETIWNMLAHQFRRFLHKMIAFLSIGITLVFFSSSDNLFIKLLCFGACIAAIPLGLIALNALQAFLLRRSDDLASHIFQ